MNTLASRQLYAVLAQIRALRSVARRRLGRNRGGMEKNFSQSTHAFCSIVWCIVRRSQRRNWELVYACDTCFKFSTRARLRNERVSFFEVGKDWWSQSGESQILFEFDFPALLSDVTQLFLDRELLYLASKTPMRVVLCINYWRA